VRVANAARAFGLAVAAIAFAIVTTGCPKPLPKTDGGRMFGVDGDGTDGDGGGGAIASDPARPRVPPPKPGAGARTLADGVVVETLAQGNGDPPVANDRITARIHTWIPDLELDDVSQFYGELRRLPYGIAAAFATMRAGERARIWVPAFDTKGAPAEPIVVDARLDALQVAPPVPPDVAKPPAKAKTSRAGVTSLVIDSGGGSARPSVEDEVVVIFTAWTADGAMLDTTTWDYGASGRTWTVRYFNQGLVDAITDMVAGEKRRLWVPLKLTEYNDGSGDDERITYDVELVEVHQKQPPPKTPSDVKKPPKSAKKTKAGVAYRFLARGAKGKPRPGPRDRVKVHYSGWTTDGKLIDSSVTRGEPSVFPLDAVMVGWTDVIQVMSPGDKLRAWIPGELAYDGRPAGPQGMLVYDIELLEIVP
jgi:FKBP-type peptidyl-prolyl cis-trans isomerase